MEEAKYTTASKMEDSYQLRAPYQTDHCYPITQQPECYNALVPKTDNSHTNEILKLQCKTVVAEVFPVREDTERDGLIFIKKFCHNTKINWKKIEEMILFRHLIKLISRRLRKGIGERSKLPTVTQWKHSPQNFVSEEKYATQQWRFF